MTSQEYKKHLHLNWNKMSGAEMGKRLKYYFDLQKKENTISLEDLSLDNLFKE